MGKMRECNRVDHYWNQQTEGLTWAQWKNTWCDPFANDYDGFIDTLLIFDWYHLMSSEMFQGAFYGSVANTTFGLDTPNCKYQYKGDSNFMCTGGGPSGDMPWVSGLINGKGQYSGA